MLTNEPDYDNEYGISNGAREDATNAKNMSSISFEPVLASAVLSNPDGGNCEFCYEKLKAGDGVMLQNCQFLHLFCKNCLQAAIESQKECAVIPCPVADETMCGGILSDAEVKELVTPEVYQEYIDRSLIIARKKMKNVFMCKTSDCGGWCEYGEGRKTFVCPRCSQTNCLECDAIHTGVSCETYKNLTGNGDYSKLQELMEREKKSGWSQLLESLRDVGDATARTVENGFIKKNLVPNFKSFDCPICFTEIEKGEGVILQDCLHTFCKDCLIQHVEHNEDVRVKCPYMDDNYTCVCYLQDCEIKALVPLEVYEKHLQRSVKLGENTMENTFHCKLPDCPGWWEVLKESGSRFECPICLKPNCISCEAIHEGSCEDYQNTILQSKNDKLSLEAVEDLIKNGSCMRCPKCKIPIFRTAGCDWVQCAACRTEICWITRGPRWGPKGHGDTSGGCRCKVKGKPCHPKCGNCH